MADYGQDHQELRRWWQNQLDDGLPVICPRCGHPVSGDQPWDLGHNDEIPGEYNGPEHRSCNRRAGGVKRQGNYHRDQDRWSL